MWEFIENIGPQPGLAADVTISLDYGQRSKARQRITLDSGAEAGLFLERGRILKDGDVLRTAQGVTARVIGKPEAVITARAGQWQRLAQACYHLGNRHAPVQIGELWLRFRPDPALEELSRHLGLLLVKEEAPFTPESRAWHAHQQAPL
jgi:urease accessory protein